MEKRRRGFLVVRIIYSAIVTVAAIMLVLSYASAYINPGKNSLPIFFGLYFAPIFVINIALLLISILFRSRSLWIGVIALFPSLLFIERFYKIYNSPESESGGKVVSVASYNLGCMNISNKNLQAYLEDLANEIKTIDADVVCLQEVKFQKDREQDTLFRQYRYSAKHLRIGSNYDFGLMILSKFPIVGASKITYNGSVNSSMFADIAIDGDTVRVFNSHLESYSLSFKSLAKRLKTKDTTYSLAKEEIFKVHRKIGKSVLVRNRQVGSLCRIIESSTYPTLVCGDFNETPMSYAYKSFSSEHIDTFVEAGKGFSSSFTLFYPLIRIDYIFAPKDFRVLSHQTIKRGISDHYPILSTIEIPQRNE